MGLARSSVCSDNTSIVSQRPHSPIHRAELPRLRLVPSRETARSVEARERRVALENRAASGLTDDDARSILALRVSEQLQGGRVALLTPESRRTLINTATMLGLRAFDANLVIAIVQDSTRRGEGLDHPQTVGRLRIVPDPKKSRTGPQRMKRSREREFTIAIVAAIVLASLMMALAIRWLTGG